MIDWITIATALAAGGTVFALCWGFPSSWPFGIQKHVDDEAEKLLVAARTIGARIPGHRPVELVYGILLLGTFLAVRVATGSIVVAVALTCGAAFVPRLVMAAIERRRWEKIDDQLPYAVDQLLSAVRAGHTLPAAIAEVGRRAPSPVAGEFDAIAREQALGAGLVESLERHSRRTRSLHFKMIDAALSLFVRQGGNITEPLQHMSTSFKEIWKLEQKMKTSSAQARATFWIVNGSTIFIIMLVFMGHPQLITSLTDNLLGNIFLVISIALYAGGVTWLRKMIRVTI